jgi:hypothetical protein
MKSWLPIEKQAITGFIGLVVILFTFGGCQKAPDISTTPFIRFDSYKFIEGGQNEDTIRLTIYFQDGDGDLGLSQGDTMAPYDIANGTNPNYYNILVDYFEQNLGTGNFDSLMSPLTYRGRFKPIFLDAQKNQPLTGTISYDIQVLNFPDDRDILFKILVKDRKLNNSNRITSGPIRIPKQ